MFGGPDIPFFLANEQNPLSHGYMRHLGTQWCAIARCAIAKFAVGLG
jgi:hypothetical protein